MFLEYLLVSSPYPMIWRRNFYVHYYILHYTGKCHSTNWKDMSQQPKNSRFRSFPFSLGFRNFASVCPEEGPAYLDCFSRNTRVQVQH